LPNYLPNYLPDYLADYLPNYLPDFLPSYLPDYLADYLAEFLADYLPVRLLRFGRPKDSTRTKTLQKPLQIPNQHSPSGIACAKCCLNRFRKNPCWKTDRFDGF
jgi:hypothetical protein